MAIIKDSVLKRFYERKRLHKPPPQILAATICQLLIKAMFFPPDLFIQRVYLNIHSLTGYYYTTDTPHKLKLQ